VLDAEAAEPAVLDDLLLPLPPQPVIASPAASANATIGAARFMGASSSLGLLPVKAGVCEPTQLRLTGRLAAAMPGAESFRASADAYNRHVGRYGAPLAAALIAFAHVEPGMCALDVGCGPGALTAALTERLGEASVCAADPSEPFAEACRARLPGVQIVVATAEALPFADHAFDATLSQLVVNFMGDAEAGVREMARVTRPGGVVASCVWDYAGEMTLLRAFWDAAREVDRERAAVADEGAIMRWCAEGELAELWRDAGLEAVRFGQLVVRAGYADFEDLWAPLPTGVAPSGAFCKSLDDERRGALHDAYRSRLGVGEGKFELTARAWAGAGIVPS
jgi:SAM-dependent methyltransferase